MTGITIVQTGDRDIRRIGHWTGKEALVAARPAMIAMLDKHRDKLEDLGRGLGVTDPVLRRGGARAHAPERFSKRQPFPG